MRCANPECNGGKITRETRNADGLICFWYEVTCLDCGGTGSKPELAGQESMFDG